MDIVKRTARVLESPINDDAAKELASRSRGTPRIAKDQKLYNAIKGTRTQHAIAKIQNDILTEALYGIMNGG